MAESINLTVKLRGVVRRKGKTWVAGCPKLNVWSQGADREDAERSLQEAVELWFEDCLSRGTLDQALREVGFRPAPWGIPLTGTEESVRLVRVAEDEDLLGSDFQVSVSVPAYQAAAQLQAQHAR